MRILTVLTLTGKAVGISTYTYDTVSGIATVGTSTYHGLSVNNKVTVAISTVGVKTDGDRGTILELSAAPFLGSFTVTKDKSDDQFEINLGAVTTTCKPISGIINIYDARRYFI